MGLYERLLEEASKEKRAPDSTVAGSHLAVVRGRPAPEAGGYVTVEDLEREQERLQRERRKALQEHKRRTSGVRVLRGLARRGVHSWVEAIAFKSLQRKYPAEWDRIRWERRTRG